MTPTRRPRELERLAVVDTVLNDGGGGRFVRALLPALKAVRPDLRITLFAPPDRVRRAGLAAEFAHADILVRGIQSARFAQGRVAGIPGSWRLMQAARRRLASAASWVPPILSGNLAAELRAIASQHDAMYFPWPFGIDPPSTSTPLVTTIHDLNFKYFFGQAYWSPEQLLRLDRITEAWVRRASVIASSDFMGREIQKFHPFAPPPTVIRLAPFSRVTRQTQIEAERRVAAMGLEQPYVLYPTHPMVHKNLGPLIAAIDYLAVDTPTLRLVLTGDGTELATGRAGPAGSMRVDQAPNVIGLGFVGNEDMDALIRLASVVISTSLYEAGNGPGVDAWGLGVPVAMSDIDVFREHIEAQGVEAALFDPRSPRSIALAIQSILRDPEAAVERGKRSKAAIDKVTWEQTAQAYLAVIEESLPAMNHNHSARF